MELLAFKHPTVTIVIECLEIFPVYIVHNPSQVAIVCNRQRDLVRSPTQCKGHCAYILGGIKAVHYGCEVICERLIPADEVVGNKVQHEPLGLDVPMRVSIVPVLDVAHEIAERHRAYSLTFAHRIVAVFADLPLDTLVEILRLIEPHINS